MKKIMLIYPPGELYQRGEDRCQLNINKSAVNSVRACNDLGYASSILKNKGYSIFLKDYQSEKLTIADFNNDLKEYSPDVIFLSTTNATIFDDLNLIKEIKNTHPNVVIILKGAIFFNCSKTLFDNIDFSPADYMIGGEEEFIIGDLIDAHFTDKSKLSKIQGIVYKDNNKYIINPNISFNEDLDSLPFPDRYEMNNKLYVIPDTGESLATISAARGCPSSCIYCLSPIISGKKVRFRSTNNVLEEMEECFHKHKIKNFFFKADTFTINKAWTIELCKKIIDSDLNGKIRWVANSRVDTVDEEMLIYMKKAGCFLIAFGLESGSDETLKRIKKNTTAAKNYIAVQTAKKAGLQTVGFYIIGFPWETKKDLEKTRLAMLKNDTDFIELHIATPFIGTQLYNILHSENKINNEVLGHNHFNGISNYNENMSVEYIENFRQKTVLMYYLRPKYIFIKIISALKNPKVIFNYARYGIRLLKNSLTR